MARKITASLSWLPFLHPWNKSLPTTTMKHSLYVREHTKQAQTSTFWLQPAWFQCLWAYNFSLNLRLTSWLNSKESTWNEGWCRKSGFNPWVRKIPWRRAWQPTPVFWPGKSHGQRSLAGYSPWGCKRVGQDWSFLQDWSIEESNEGMKVKVAQSCLTLCNPMVYTVHGILQTRILEWVDCPFSRGSSQPRDQTQVSHIAGGFFTSWATREEYWSG